jgi:hypothetical protein
MRPKPNPHFPPALDPIYPLDPVFYLFYTFSTFSNKKQLVVRSESGSRTRGGYLIQGEGAGRWKKKREEP